MSRQRFDKLLEPLQVGAVRFRNRMVSAPHTLRYEIDGYVEERGNAFYEAVARGGVGMIVVGCFYAEASTARGFPHLRIDDDKFVPRLAGLTRLIHNHGCPTFAQLGHPGPAEPYARTGCLPVAASSLSKDESPIPTLDVARELTVAEIEHIVDRFTKAAERVRKAGFDGVEVHAAHSYLLNSFLSRAWNRRDDAYGCQELESRARFPVEVIRAIRECHGRDFPIGVRINGREWGVDDGITSEESQGFARAFEEAGADYLSVAGYGYGPHQFWMFPEMAVYPEPTEELAQIASKMRKPGPFITEAAAIRKGVSVPVMGVGKLNPELGEWLLENGKVDLIGLARPLMADPELPNKVASGRLEDIRPCQYCHECGAKVGTESPLRCRVNAALGVGHDDEIRPAEKRKRVMIVGGGPAGMEAARVASLRGHEVVIYEREHKLGGLLPLAAYLKGPEIEDLEGLVRYFKRQLKKSGVKIVLGREVDRALVAKTNPDAVILATGGVPNIPRIPGIDGRNVIRIPDIARIPARGSVVIMGGSVQGCEAAEFLVKQGKRVTIAEESDQLGTGMPDRPKWKLLKWLGEKGVIMLTEVKYEGINGNGLTIVTKDGKRQTIEADTVLLATQPRENTTLFKALEGVVPEIHLIGDAKGRDLIPGAVHDGWSIGRAV